MRAEHGRVFSSRAFFCAIVRTAEFFAGDQIAVSQPAVHSGFPWRLFSPHPLPLGDAHALVIRLLSRRNLALLGVQSVFSIRFAGQARFFLYGVVMALGCKAGVDLRPLLHHRKITAVMFWLPFPFPISRRDFPPTPFFPVFSRYCSATFCAWRCMRCPYIGWGIAIGYR